jgi:TM2 domain-containing membrane protein YozV
MAYQPPDPPGLPPTTPPGYPPQPPGYAPRREPKKSAIVALILSFFLPGVGHIYVGSIGLGIAVLCLWLVSLVLIFFLIGIIMAPVVWLFAMAHSAVSAERINAERGYS